MGFKRYLGGTADFLTGNIFDFDKRGRPNDPGNNQGEKKGNTKRKEVRRKNFPDQMGYPIARGQSERTGDSLLIQCRTYIAPKTGITGEPALLRTKSAGPYAGTEYGKGQFVVNASGNQAGTFKKTFVPGTVKMSNLGASDRGSEKGVKDVFSVELPIPQDINDSNTVTWGDDNMNIFMLAGLSAANSVLGSPGESFEAAKEFLTNKGIDLSALDAETQNAVRASVAGKAIDVMGGQIRPNSAIGRASGMILNSNLELLFDSVNLRTFPFSINFSPRTPEESQMVKHIIRAFKSSMAAKKGIDEAGGQGGVFLRAPDVYAIKYLHNGTQHPFLNSFKDCALTGMTVNYTNAGTYTTYEDGTPVSIKMNLTFKELNPIYHEDYTNSIPGVGF